MSIQYHNYRKIQKVTIKNINCLILLKIYINLKHGVLKDIQHLSKVKFSQALYETHIPATPLANRACNALFAEA